MKIQLLSILAISFLATNLPCGLHAAVPVGEIDLSAEELTELKEHHILFNVFEQSDKVYCYFKTEYRCISYAIEAKLEENDEFTSLVYCNDAMCLDARNSVSMNFDLNEYAYRFYRIRTTLLSGDVIYSLVKKVSFHTDKEIELVNSAVTELLLIKWNSEIHTGYTWSLSGINGEAIKNDEILEEGPLDMGFLNAGFYIISFKSLNGNFYHYKFFKTINL